MKRRRCSRLRGFLTLLGALSWFSAARAAEPEPWANLPPCIPSGFPELGYVEYESYKLKGAESPFTFGPLSLVKYFRLSGDREVSLNLDFSEAITEDHFAWVPSGSPVVIERRPDGRDTWSFPTGATFVHRMIKQDSAHSILEVRLSRRMGNGIWSFGMYDALEHGLNRCRAGELELRTRDIDARDVHFTHRDPSIGRMKLTYQPLGTRHCAMCHGMDLPGTGRNRDEISTCGFRPDFSEGEHGFVADTAGWYDRYRERYGSAPFVRRIAVRCREGTSVAQSCFTDVPERPDIVPRGLRSPGPRQ